MGGALIGLVGNKSKQLPPPHRNQDLDSHSVFRESWVPTGLSWLPWLGACRLSALSRSVGLLSGNQRVR